MRVMSITMELLARISAGKARFGIYFFSWSYRICQNVGLYYVINCSHIDPSFSKQTIIEYLKFDLLSANFF